MRKHLSRAAYGAAAFGLTLAFGCSTTPTEQTHQFTPVPIASVGEQELEPAVAARPATDLLKAADEAFRKANEAQERGDQKEALRHYNTMLQLMIEADLDPAVFYGLRTEFERILDSSSETADLFERSGASEYADDNLNQRPSGGELFSKGFINERVITEIEEIQKLYPRNFQGGLDRSNNYRPYIEQELEKAGLPKDLVWLAMVESQFHPSVTSRAGAVGMWQFMRATGTRYGLRVDNYVDERRDWQKATHAAIRYLTDLNTMFGGDWPLAVSSYNMGEGGISRSIAMNGGERDLWKLMETPPASNHMKQETKKFYPKLLASVLVGKNPERYGFKRNPSAPEQVLRVPVRGSYSLAMLDKEAGLPSGTLKRLNPDLIKGVTPVSGEHALAVPAEASDRMVAALDTLYKQPKRATYASSGSGTHTVRRGETPSGIARKYGISAKELMDANRIRSASKLSVGRKLVIPGRGEDPIALVEEPVEQEVVKETREESAAETKAAPSAEPKTYRVKRGDTLYDIARAHDVSLSDLQAWNKLDRHARIRVGESLVVGSSTESPAAVASPAGEKQVHRVKPGEFPSKIAQNYGVSLDQLLAWNNLTKKSVIRAGDELVLYAPAGNAPAERVEVAKSTAPERVQPDAPAAEPAPAAVAETPKKTHTVSSGETASTIAAKYGMSLSEFLNLNNLTRSSVLQIGQKCVVGEGASSAATKTSPQAEASATHTVGKGESAWTIAAKYGMDVDALLAMNRLSKDSVLKAGQELKVSGEVAAPAASSETSAATKVHKVVKGETASTIAQKYGMSTKTLLALNSLSKDAVLQVGQELKVSGKAADKTAGKAETASKTITHKTTAGQSPASIAKKYGVSTGDLFKWNNWSKNHVLKIGEEVTIHVP
ncbi:MAG: LysM peptidoglycan-binding domain-containing protein [Candidatus Hydrogenedentes bacterium]|nr:LysM peptidoglycan-binding domain-containing protein [Candidatus Hydrogenedentota bacterium]